MTNLLELKLHLLSVNAKLAAEAVRGCTEKVANQYLSEVKKTYNEVVALSKKR
jgi:hypothetical protein